jgi:zinc protease
MKMMIQAGPFVLLLAILTCSGSIRASAQQEVPALSKNESYEKINEIKVLGNLTIQQYQLPNGLQVAIVRDTTTPIFTYQTWFKTGSADEAPGYQGLAHLFEST